MKNNRMYKKLQGFRSAFITNSVSGLRVGGSERVDELREKALPTVDKVIFMTLRINAQ